MSSGIKTKTGTSTAGESQEAVILFRVGLTTLILAIILAFNSCSEIIFLIEGKTTYATIADGPSDNIDIGSAHILFPKDHYSVKYNFINETTQEKPFGFLSLSLSEWKNDYPLGTTFEIQYLGDHPEVRSRPASQARPALAYLVLGLFLLSGCLLIIQRNLPSRSESTLGTVDQPQNGDNDT